MNKWQERLYQEIDNGAYLFQKTCLAKSWILVSSDGVRYVNRKRVQEMIDAGMLDVSEIKKCKMAFPGADYES